MKSGQIEGYDAVFLSPHKFVGGPGTPGILLMNKALYRLNSQPPSTCGGGTVAYVNGFSEQVRITNEMHASVRDTKLYIHICSYIYIP
jgi:selenocysteine lyase/cysteine desulfurase